MNSLLLQNREWLIQPEALQSMATSLRGLSEHEFFPKKATENPLLTIEDGIGVIAIEGPILRKPDLIARRNKLPGIQGINCQQLSFKIFLASDFDLL